MKRAHKQIGEAESQRDRERAKARGVFALERVVSYGSGEGRWRTKLEFGSGEPLDDSHRSAALGAVPSLRRLFHAGSMWSGLWLWCRAEQVKAKWQELGAFAVGQETEVTNAHEAFRKDVE